MDFKQFYKTMQFDIDNEIRTVYQATQGDTKSRGLLVDLIVGGVRTPVTTETMNFFALKPDGTRVMTAGVKDGDKFRIDFTNQTFAVTGTLLCALVLYGTNGEKIADKKFKMTVDESLEDGAIVSENERSILDRAFDLANDIVPRLEALDVPLLENLEQRFDNLIATPVPTGEIIAEEIIDARDGEASVGAKIRNVDEQLAQTSAQAYSTIKHDATTNIIVSFVDDDGNKRVMSHVKPIFDSENVPASVAIITQHTDVNDQFMTSSDLKELKASGWTVASHGHEHIWMGEATEEELKYDIKTAKDKLDSIGCDGDILVYPYGSRSNLAKKVARKYSIGAFTTGGLYNTTPIDQFGILRIADISGSMELADFDKAKQTVENAPQGSWLIFYTHSGSSAWNLPETTQYMKELIGLIKLKGYDIVNLREGLNLKSNIVDVGDDENAFLKIGRDGSFIHNNLLDNTNISASTPVGDFPLGESKITFSSVESSGKGFPHTAGWLLTTYRPPYLSHTLKSQGADQYSYQTLSTTGSTKVYRRRWSAVDSDWTAFETVQQTYKDTSNSHYFHGLELNAYTGNDLVSAFPSYKITTFLFDSTNSTGFPCEQGIVTTYRSGRVGYDRQECREYNGYGLWVRWTNPMGGVFSEWEKYAIHDDIHVWVGEVAMGTTFRPLGITRCTAYVDFEKIYQSEGLQPELSKTLWKRSELSSDSSNPTIIGEIGTAGTVKLHCYVDDNDYVYLKYSDSGYTRSAFVKTAFC